MAYVGADVEFPVAEVEGAHRGGEVDTAVGHVAAVAPVVGKAYDIAGFLLHEQVAGLGGVEVERHGPTVGEKACVEAETPCAGGLPLETVVAYVGDYLPVAYVVEVFRGEVGAIGIEGYLVVTCNVEACANLEQVEEFDVAHPFFRRHEPCSCHRGEEAPSHTADFGSAGGVVAKTGVALEHGIDIEDVALQVGIFAGEVPCHVAPFEVLALSEVERRRGVAQVVDIVRRGVMAFAVGVDVGVVLVTEASGKSQTVLDAAQGVVEEVEVGNEGGVAVHEALDHVAAFSVDFTVFVDEVALVDAIVGEE